jgi:hypothetical protein
MNKRLVKKKRPARAASKASPKTSPKAGRSQTVRKASTRTAASHKSASRQALKTSAKTSAQALKPSAKTSAPASAAKAASVAKKSTARQVSSANKIAAAKIVAARTASAKVAAKGSAILPLSRVVRLPETEKIVSSEIAAISVTEVTALNPAVRSHKFRVGQTVSYTSSPISRPGASGSYQVVRLLPSDGDDYQYRIKNPGEAFERVAKESQLELDR